MELSKNGKNYLSKCNRIEFLSILEVYRVKHLYEEPTMIYDLVNALAYYINKVSDDARDANIELNGAIRDLVSEVNRFSSDKRGLSEYQEQIWKDFKDLCNS